MATSPDAFTSKEEDVGSLKADHDSRPIYVSSDGRILLEAFSPISDRVSDFLTTVAEPISRPHHIHEYKLTEYSLYAAVSVGLQTISILDVLERLSKSPLPAPVIQYVKKYTSTYGKVKLVQKENSRFYVESPDQAVLKILLRDDIVSGSRVWSADDLGSRADEYGFLVEAAPTSTLFRPSKRKREGDDLEPGAKAIRLDESTKSVPAPSIPPAPEPLPAPKDCSSSDTIDLFDMFDVDVDEPLLSEDLFALDTTIGTTSEVNVPSQPPDETEALQADDQPLSPIHIPLRGEEILGALISINEQDDGEEADGSDPTSRKPKLVSSFEIRPEAVEAVKRQCSNINFPMLEEYDFKRERDLPDLRIDLKPSTCLRPYQEKALNKMFGNGRARSGIIVLPCGAGKTLVGVTAACTIKKSCLVLCTSSVSVEQWAREFKSWSTIGDRDICKFTSDKREKFPGESGVLISTYTMIGYTGKRAYDAKQVMDFVTSREWGFVLLDEVHVVPADMFKKVLTIVTAHSKLGLTATLVREDDKIRSLNYLIGPKLYEANWMDLATKGFIANVQCAEVWCEMPKEFFREYLEQDARKRQLLYSLNPKKIQACQYLIEFHEARGDKIIIFSDNVFALKHYATVLNKPYIYGGTSQAERIRILQQFRYNPTVNAIFLSKVGDTSIDIPEASCLIQISSHYGSRRQEAQRLGRILRAKKTMSDGFNAFFYTLVSKDTEEVYYSSKRQQFLIDQGYSFKIITQLEGAGSMLLYSTLAERLELLTTILVSGNDATFDMEEDEQEILTLLNPPQLRRL
ncbi:P-loop containing nucleoside triphosphate hydrolase protein [Chytridium lagenaria]|nr:P-loop containing nucleoside triphosphate hydrolase protein [Chytridium lagenaria]